MLGQLPTPPVETPDVVWSALSPILALAVGAILLIMFRSIVKRMPEEYDATLTMLVGPVTVLAMWIVGGLVGTDVPLADLRDDVGEPAFYIGLALVLIVSALFVKALEIGFDAAFTVGVGLVSFAATVVVWQQHFRAQPITEEEFLAGVAPDFGGPIAAFGTQYGVDGFALVFGGVIALAVVLSALLFDDYLRREGIDGAEMYVLLMLSAAGGLIMAGSNDLIVLFLGLETLSIAVYVMAAMHTKRTESLESGLKYFILGAFSSAFLLYGMAMIYGATGSLNLVGIRIYLESVIILDNAMLLAGFALLLVGLGFKVAAVPFHAWTPDVYQGAPTPVVAFMASAVKAAAFAALVRVFYLAFIDFRDDWQPVIYAMAVLTLLVGAFLAIVQRDAKRMLAYSSIGHAGFILVGVQAATERGVASVVFYAAAYTFMVVGSFGVLSVVSGRGDRASSLDDLNGLNRRSPVLAFALTLFLLGQAGVPLTTGFVAKFEVLSAAVDARSYWLAVIAMISAVVSAFLYLRIVLSMYLGTVDEDAEPISVHPTAALAIGVALVLTIGFGLVPGPIDQLANDAILALAG
ncbi:MAG: NADH-quinone oxidoreductase subunit N [Acidimicrobiales bacterium]|jgi:NADH-quinone oxidoreductase subunit N|nr:NADH-quinone oxidoreductase subunit N [Acidimicrobiales bacterium]